MCQNRGNRVFTWSKRVDDASFLVLQHRWGNPSFCQHLIKLPGMCLSIRTTAAFSELMLALHFLSRDISSQMKSNTQSDLICWLLSVVCLLDDVVGCTTHLSKLSSDAFVGSSVIIYVEILPDVL